MEETPLSNPASQERELVFVEVSGQVKSPPTIINHQSSRQQKTHPSRTATLLSRGFSERSTLK